SRWSRFLVSRAISCARSSSVRGVCRHHMLQEPPDWQMVRARIATFPPARHIGFAKTSQWISFQKSARCRSEADNRGALLPENLCCAPTQLVGIALAFLCEPNDELRNRRCHSSLAVNDAELARRRVKQSLKMECPDVAATCFCLHDCNGHRVKPQLRAGPLAKRRQNTQPSRRDQDGGHVKRCGRNSAVTGG